MKQKNIPISYLNTPIVWSQTCGFIPYQTRVSGGCLIFMGDEMIEQCGKVRHFIHRFLMLFLRCSLQQQWLQHWGFWLGLPHDETWSTAAICLYHPLGAKWDRWIVQNIYVMSSIKHKIISKYMQIRASHPPTSYKSVRTPFMEW